MNNRPKTLRYREALDAAEKRIIEALPEIIDRLIEKAKEGDAKTAVYLIDRILGKATGATFPPAEDKRPAYTEADFKLDQQEHESGRHRRQMVARILSGAGKRA